MRLAQHATVSLALMLAGCGQTPHTMAEKYYLVVPNTKSPYWDQDYYDPQAQKREFKRIAALKPAGKPEVDAFISMEGQSAKEVAEVLSRRRAKKVVVAMDALAPTLEGIENGWITATVAQEPFTMGYTSLRLIADLYLTRRSAQTCRWKRIAQLAIWSDGLFRWAITKSMMDAKT